MSVSTKQFHETNFLVCHIINILLSYYIGYLRESWYRPQEKFFFYPRPSTKTYTRRRVSRLLSKAFVNFGFMALFGFISSPFSSPWLAIIYSIVQYCKHWPVALFRLFFTNDSCFPFNFFIASVQPHIQNVRSTSGIVCSLFFENPAKKKWHTSAANRGPGAFLVRAWPPCCTTPSSCVRAHEQYR